MQLAPTWNQWLKTIPVQVRAQNQIEAQRNGFDLERRSSAMSALWLLKKAGASDMKLAPTWRGGWDSNPRAVARKLISSQPRYDHFDTAAYKVFRPENMSRASL